MYNERQRFGNVVSTRLNTGGHPKCIVFVKAMNVSDDSGRISALESRKDIQALRLFVMLAKAQRYSEEEQVFGLFLAMQWYTTEAIAYWSSDFLRTPAAMHTRKTCLQAMERVTSAFKGIKRNADGKYGSTGHTMLMNPAERNQGSERYAELCEHVAGIRRASHELCKVPQPLKVKDMLQALNKIDGVYGDQVCYKNMRAVRCIAAAMDWLWQDQEDCWTRWRTMSGGMKAKCKRLFVWEYHEAMHMRDELRKKIHKKYSLADLICFVCLMPRPGGKRREGKSMD